MRVGVDGSHDPADDTARHLDHRSVIGKTAVLGLLTVVARLFAFGAIVAATRHFGASGLGAIGFAQQVSMIAVIAGTCGLETLAIRAAVQKPSTIGTIAATSVALRVGIGIPLFLGLVGLTWVVPQLAEVRVLLWWFGLSIFTGAFTLLWLPQALQRSHVFGLTHLLIQGVYLVGVLIGIAVDAGIWVVPAAFVTGELVGAAALAVWSKRTIGSLGPLMSATDALAFLREAVPIGTSQLLRTLSTGSDLVLAGFFLGLHEVGWYTGAFKIYLLGSASLGIYFVVVFPVLAQLASGPRARFRRELRGSTLRLLALAAPAALAGIVLAEWGLSLVFDESFAAAAAPLQILLSALLVTSISGHARQGLLALGRQRQDLLIVAIGTSGHIGLKLALVPNFGLIGAAWGTLLGEMILLVVGGLAIRGALRGPADAIPSQGDVE